MTEMKELQWTLDRILGMLFHELNNKDASSDTLCMSERLSEHILGEMSTWGYATDLYIHKLKNYQSEVKKREQRATSQEMLCNKPVYVSIPNTKRGYNGRS